MSSNKELMTLLITGILLTACQTMTQIPEAYNFNIKETKITPYGCWTILEIKSDQNLLVPDTIAGEMVCMEADTLYILVSDKKVRTINKEVVIKAELYTHRKLAGTYAGITTLFLVPHFIGALIYIGDFGGDFLIMGIPIAVMGLSQILIEGSSHQNRLIYPAKDSLESLSHFARFPGGKPVSIDLNQLTLKKISK